jgi:CRISPR-associated protein Csb2
MQPYGPPTPERRLYPEPVLDRLWQIFTLEPAEGMPPANLGAGDGVAVARAVRQALARECDTAAEPVPDVVRELMTGRAATTAGGPAAAARSERPHLAVVPLPWVGHRHADGLVKGVALLLPRELSPEVRRAALAVIGRWQASDPDGVRLEFADDNAGTWALGPVGDGVTIATLTAWRWCRPTATWSTATPIALDGYPGDLRSRDPGRAAKAWAKAAGLIARSCSRIGLPAPDDVEISRDPVVAGASPARAFPAFRSSGNDPGRVLVHAVIRFPEPVRGPVLLGAGRYLGLGLCLPTNQERFNG